MPLKLLYAASNRAGAKLQLFRFLDAIKNFDVVIKIAGFKHMKMHLDWTLDALEDIIYHNWKSTDNDNFEIYFQQLKQFNPDLVISDLEYYSSYAAQLLNIPTWQISPLLLWSATEVSKRNEHNIKRDYGVLLQELIENKLLENVIVNSDRKFVYSCLGDLDNSPKLLEGYEWIRPYYYIGKQSKPCHHNLVIATHKINKKINNLLKENDDSIIFSDPSLLNVKNIYNIDEYACNIKNSKYLVNSGLTDLITDALYNDKQSIVIPDLFDLECAINTNVLQNYELIMPSYNGKFTDNQKEINMKHNKSIKFLHEHIFK